jgi:dihydroflavonol-4-reductase
LKNERILVVGASGFVGKNLVQEMAARKHINILVRPTSNIDLFKHNSNITIRYGDLEADQGIEQAMEGIDLVINCAAKTMGRSYWEFYNMNTLGTANLIRAMTERNVPKILFLSSHAACGPSAGIVPTDEQHAQIPISFYGRTKKIAEELIRSSPLSYTIIRPVSVYGPHDKEILTYVKLLNKGFCPVIGYGPKYLNLIYVKDLVDLMIAFVDRDLFANRTYFANDGRCYSLYSILDTIANALGRKNVKIHIPASIALFVGLLNDVLVPPRKKLVTRDKIRELACQAWVCSSIRTIEEIDFHPRYSFERGIIETIDWYRENGFL